MITSSIDETYAFGRKLAKQLIPGDIVAFYGDLGAGKTTLAKGIIQELASIAEREVLSPTFTYLNIYEAFPPIFHFDLYRLKEEKEFVDMGFLDFLNENNICLIEWPNRISSLLPDRTLRIELSFLEETKRRIYVQKC